MPIPTPEQVDLFQNHWRFCQNCFGLFFNGDPNRKGSCPSPAAPAPDRRHVAQGFDFYLPGDKDNPPG
jgi:hypothetical protein